MIDVNDVKNRLHQYQLGGLGIAAPILSPQWSAANPSYNGATATPALTLTFGSTWKAPFAGVLTFAELSSNVACELDATPVAGVHALLAVHPQAFARLARLYAKRYDGSGELSLRPVPAYVAIRRATSTSGLGMVRAGEDLPAGDASFHDRRGLIIDPLAVSSAFEDLLRTFPALVPSGVTLNPADLATSAGFVGTIARLAGTTATRTVHVVDLHGNPWSDPGQGKGLAIHHGGSTTRIADGGPFDFPQGATIEAEATAPQPLRWGLATNGTLSSSPFSVAALGSGATLIRDFIRVAAVHVQLHVFGNRTTDEISGVKGCDTASAVDVVKPVVRDGSTVTPFVDGMGVLGAMSEMLTRASANTPNELYAAAPAISDTFDIPLDTTPASRWDQAASADILPPTPATPTAWVLDHAKNIRPGHGGVTAAWAAADGPDVIVTIAPGLAPPGAHVRVYPRVFLTGPSLTESRTLFRGDGSAAIAGTTSDPVHILLTDPLNLRGNPRPANPVLHFDLHVVPRPPSGPTRERIFGGYVLSIAAFSAGATVPLVHNLLGLIPNDRRALCSTPVLGLPPRPGPSFSISNPSDLVAIVKALASEQSPRESPRFPTMARTDAIGGFGTPTGASPPQRWDATLTGGFFTSQTHTEKYHRGNPGGPAGPDIHAAGVAASGQLGYDLALAANRRVHNLVSRLIDFAGSAWDPLPDPTAPSTQVGAVLQTIAPICETPELSLYPEDRLASLPDNWADLQADIASLIPGFSVPGGGSDRLIKEAKREFYISRYGARDLQWSLRYAVGHARELIYIEAPAFQSTAAKDDPESYAWDLVATLVDRLKARSTLRLVVAVPKKLAFGRQYDAWAKAGYVARTAANDLLSAAAGDRVVIMHPVGFPGRPLTIRSTSIVVDDVWCAIGTSAPRRRGFTFDGGSDLVWFDRALTNGRCAPVRDFRRALMAQYFGVAPPANGATPDPNWARLAEPRSAFEAMRELVAQGGRGLVEPLWSGPSDDTTIAQSPDIADPEGRTVSALLAMLVSGLADLESEPA